MAVPTLPKFLVVGSSGQIGTAFSLACRKRLIPALGLDRRPNIWEPSVTPIRKDFLQFDLSPSEGITDIIFLATEASARRLEESPEQNQKDYAAFEHAVVLAQRHHVRLSIISSRELFAFPPNKISNFVPKNIYEEQKRDFEARLYELEKTGYAYGILRVPIVFGGYDTDIQRLPRLIPRLCLQVLNGKATELTTGSQLVELAYIEEVAGKLLNAFLSNEKSFLEEVHGIHISLAELAEIIKGVWRDYKNKKDGADSDLLRRGIAATFLGLQKS